MKRSGAQTRVARHCLALLGLILLSLAQSCGGRAEGNRDDTATTQQALCGIAHTDFPTCWEMIETSPGNCDFWFPTYSSCAALTSYVDSQAPFWERMYFLAVMQGFPVWSTKLQPERTGVLTGKVMVADGMGQAGLPKVTVSSVSPLAEKHTCTRSTNPRAAGQIRSTCPSATGTARTPLTTRWTDP